MPNPRRYANAAQRQAAYRRRVAAARTLEPHGPGPLLPVPAPRPGHPRWQTLLRHSLRFLDIVQTEMQDYYDERSEVWQESEKGDAFQERLQAVQEVYDGLEELTPPLKLDSRASDPTQ